MHICKYQGACPPLSIPPLLSTLHTCPLSGVEADHHLAYLTTEHTEDWLASATPLLAEAPPLDIPRARLRRPHPPRKPHLLGNRPCRWLPEGDASAQPIFPRVQARPSTCDPAHSRLRLCPLGAEVSSFRSPRRATRPHRLRPGGPAPLGSLALSVARPAGGASSRAAARLTAGVGAARGGRG